MQRSSNNPITAVCVVADPGKCPPAYELLMKSSDKKDDCDLWKDGVFKSKVSRYLCFSRTDQNKVGPKEVLVDLSIQNDREVPPSGFRMIDKTLDTCEKATNKKLISAKMLPVNATTDAISDIILLSRSKRAPAGYTAAGDLNGFVLCFKMSKLTVTEKVTPQPSATGKVIPQPSAVKTGGANDEPKSNETYAVNWWGVPVPYQPKSQRASECTDGLWPYGGSSDGSYVCVSVPASTAAHPTSSAVTKSSTGPNPMFDIPFLLNTKFADETSFDNMKTVPKVSYKSLADIENEYAYVFNLESSTITGSQTRM